VTELQWWEMYFGDPWPSEVCEMSIQVSTPVGDSCVLCEEPIQDSDQGTFMGAIPLNGHPSYGPVHRECSLRAVLGGIGHLENHEYWCAQMHDPDGGRTYRASAVLVWHWVQVRGFPA
jgi:hypothetical protein